MIECIKGNLLESKADALVNTVNTVGVMGKGIALQFKNKYPYNYKVYRDACKKGTFKTGEVLVVQEADLLGQKFIVNFPTKAHWKGASKYEYIASGLKALKQAMKDYNIASIAIPPLGCGNGGLEWNKVKNMIEEELKDVEAEIFLYGPNEQIKTILQKENTQKKVELSPARAMLMYLLFNYESVGEQSSLFVANKLAYFLQRKGEKLRLNFEAYHYGPYAVQLNHVLLHLNGVYLRGMEQNVAKPFEPLFLNYEKKNEIAEYLDKTLSSEQKQRLEDVKKLLSRFESTHALELLATVDYIIHQYKTEATEEIMAIIKSWSKRKSNLFEPKHVAIAINHLKDNASDLSVMVN